VQIGGLSHQDLEQELAAYHGLREGPLDLTELYRGLPGSGMLEVFTEVTVKLFTRVAHETVRPGPSRVDPGTAHRCDFSFLQRVRGDLSCQVCLGLSGDLVHRVAERLVGWPFTPPEEDALDGTAEFLDLIVGRARTQLSVTGWRTQQELPRVIDNRGGGGLDVETLAGQGQVTITPLLHPDSEIELMVIAQANG
jgi:hypothetical protein